jgi:hypothetical protein
MIAVRGNYTVSVEPIIKKGRKRERGEEGKRGEKEGKKEKKKIDWQTQPSKEHYEGRRH